MHKWDSRILTRYILLQLPALVLFIVLLVVIQGWVVLPTWLFWGAIVIWVLKDAVLYPLVWRAYNPEQSDRVMSLIGAQGIAKEPLAPSGYIQVRGVLWKAELMQDCPPVAEGDAVRVNQRRGLTLLVQPWDAADSNTC
jgi:membrane protein implicated in regulation of membrane protease activity